MTGGRREGPEGQGGAPASRSAAVKGCPGAAGRHLGDPEPERTPADGLGAESPAPSARWLRPPAQADGRHPQTAFSPGHGWCPGPQALGQRHRSPAAAFTCCVAAAARFHSPRESPVVVAVAAAAAAAAAAANSQPPPPQVTQETGNTTPSLSLSGPRPVRLRVRACPASRAPSSAPRW